MIAGSGDLYLGAGALILAATNVTCINLAAVATFFLQSVRPRDWWEARRATRIAGGVWVAMLLLLAGLMALVRAVP